ncbi:Guanine nucleotide-binding protein-like NSN1 [Sesamum angolense]|uniref:Guanine nucleotide-binding protein-like NSN1 n=1 Tax=Sesamum angolense TaxID=2727404 RepID=A0AAE2C419_9LAMI|nr:Guanine nucleotide-binding protein-like NSN1 [Sesamum angolense]
MQQVHLDKIVKLLDCPGVVMLKSAANDEKLDDPVGPDVGAAARIVLHDWNEGKIPYYTMPPNRNAEEPSEAKIVSELGKEFNVDGGESSFLGSLKSVNDLNPVQDDAAAEAPSQVDDQSMGSEEENKVVKDKSASSRQNEKLYAEEGMLNAKLRKAEERRRKKENQSSAVDHNANEDYDFKVDYIKEETAMDTGDQVGMADEKTKTDLSCLLE